MCEEASDCMFELMGWPTVFMCYSAPSCSSFA